MPLREVRTTPPDVVLDCQHHRNIVYDDERAQPRVTVEPSDYQLNHLSGSQRIEVHESMDELSTGMSYRSASRSPSLRSHGIAVTRSQNPSVRGSQATVNSAQSTPKMLRLPRILPIGGSRDSMPRNNIPTKETLKRTASHTPEVTRPAKSCSLRRTKSASHSLGDDPRFSADFSVCSDQTSCESLSSEAATPTRKQYLGVPIDNLGECSKYRMKLCASFLTRVDELLVWVFIAQLVEHCSANAEATGSNLVEASKNFFSAISQLLKLRFNFRWPYHHFIYSKYIPN